MKNQYIGKIPSFPFEKRLILALDSRWLDLNDGQPLEFEARIENDRLILASVNTKVR